MLYGKFGYVSNEKNKIEIIQASLIFKVVSGVVKLV